MEVSAVPNRKEEHHFDFLWEVVVLPIIQRSLSEIDSDYKKECYLRCENFCMYKKRLEKIYKRKREWLKRVYLPNDKNPILDMHKIGALLCRSIIGDKPISFDLVHSDEYVERNNKNNDKQWLIDNAYVNYKIAFYVSVGLLYIEMISDLRETGKDEKADIIEQDGALYFYPKSPTHENFQSSCIIGLMKNDIASRDFDYLSYAAMLFQLERYNYIKYGIDLKDIFDTDELL